MIDKFDPEKEYDIGQEIKIGGTVCTVVASTFLCLASNVRCFLLPDAMVGCSKYCKSYERNDRTSVCFIPKSEEIKAEGNQMSTKSFVDQVIEKWSQEDFKHLCDCDYLPNWVEYHDGVEVRCVYKSNWEDETNERYTFQRKYVYSFYEKGFGERFLKFTLVAAGDIENTMELVITRDGNESSIREVKKIEYVAVRYE